MSRSELVGNPEREVLPEERGAVMEGICRLEAGEPIQYVVGWTDFYGLRLVVTPDVLIPRPETEVLVEEALALVPRDRCRVLDIGTGSGCIALAIKSVFRDARVVGTDIDSAALGVASANSEALGLNVEFIEADVEEPGVIRLLFELIVSNPPYIPSAERDSLPRGVLGFEPSAALFCGNDPLRFYRAILGVASRTLVDGGHLVVETHADYVHDVAVLFEKSGLDAVSVRSDLAGRPRIVRARRAPKV